MVRAEWCLRESASNSELSDSDCLSSPVAVCATHDKTVVVGHEMPGGLENVNVLLPVPCYWYCAGRLGPGLPECPCGLRSSSSLSSFGYPRRTEERSGRSLVDHSDTLLHGSGRAVAVEWI